MPLDPPSPIIAGFDRADGIGGRVGTPTPAYALKVTAVGGVTTINDIPFEEEPDSPELERAEQATFTHRFRLSWAEALNRIAFIGRGSILKDSFGNIFFVLSVRVQRQAGGWATFVVTSEAKSFDSPPDEFTCDPVELGLNIIKHPRYFRAFIGSGPGSDTEAKNQMVIRLLQEYFENPNFQFRNALLWMLQESASTEDGVPSDFQPPYYEFSKVEWKNTNARVAGTAMAKAAAMEIIMKYWRGEETPYVVGYQITHSQYFFIPPPIIPGGFIENPLTEAAPQLPDYFWSRVFPPKSNATIFDYFASSNPQCYSSNGLRGGPLNISWLRKADQLEYQRTWFKRTRTWIGSAIGYWDPDIYTQDNGPQSASDYRVPYVTVKYKRSQAS